MKNIIAIAIAAISFTALSAQAADCIEVKTTTESVCNSPFFNVNEQGQIVHYQNQELLLDAEFDRVVHQAVSMQDQDTTTPLTSVQKKAQAAWVATHKDNQEDSFPDFSTLHFDNTFHDTIVSTGGSVNDMGGVAPTWHADMRVPRN